MDFNILDSIPCASEYKTFTERYFSKRYLLDVEGIENNDILLMFHSNRICLLTLAPSHYFFNKLGKYRLNFSVGHTNRLKNIVKGKGKKGGQCLGPHSIICKIEYYDGTVIDVPCGMKGALVEVNEALVKDPSLLKLFPDSDGFIAIILSSIAISEATKNELIDEEEYKRLKCI